MRTRTFLTGLAVCSTIMGGAVQADSPAVLVVASDLQHHRWILESINDEALSTEETDGMIPELDFGEQMHVSGNSGCNQISGQAELRGEFFRIPALASTFRLCSPDKNELELTVQGVLGQESRISLDEGRNLTLATDDVILRFRLRDWVN